MMSREQLPTNSHLGRMLMGLTTCFLVNLRSWKPFYSTTYEPDNPHLQNNATFPKHKDIPNIMIQYDIDLFGEESSSNE